MLHQTPRGCGSSAPYPPRVSFEASNQSLTLGLAFSGVTPSSQGREGAGTERHSAPARSRLLPDRARGAWLMTTGKPTPFDGSVIVTLGLEVPAAAALQPVALLVSRPMHAGLSDGPEARGERP